ncbi:hypothetical protein GEV39_00515 [Pseudomonas sp. NY5710]|nr:hypothetical protein GEV39_00515 [Pseudomonas sp. NY5710]
MAAAWPAAAERCYTPAVNRRYSFASTGLFAGSPLPQGPHCCRSCGNPVGAGLPAKRPAQPPDFLLL